MWCPYCDLVQGFGHQQAMEDLVAQVVLVDLSPLEVLGDHEGLTEGVIHDRIIVVTQYLLLSNNLLQ